MTIDTTTTDCLVKSTADYDLTVLFSTREGIIEGSYSWGETSITLIGHSLMGINTDIPTFRQG